MAEEKQDDAEEKEGGGKKKKKGLPAIVLVLLGAAAGGAGVVFMAPAPAPEPHGPPPKVIKLFDHPDKMEFTINPVVTRGHKTAVIHFLFSYKADEMDVISADAGHDAGGGGHGGGHGAPAEPTATDLPLVPRSIKLNWNRAYSRCLEVLTNQTAETLLNPEGKRQVKRLLIDELTATLFPDGIAAVDDILWTKFVVQ